jgi:hypothetical protein
MIERCLAICLHHNYLTHMQWWVLDLSNNQYIADNHFLFMHGIWRLWCAAQTQHRKPQHSYPPVLPVEQLLSLFFLSGLCSSATPSCLIWNLDSGPSLKYRLCSCPYTSVQFGSVQGTFARRPAAVLLLACSIWICGTLFDCHWILPYCSCDLLCLYYTGLAHLPWLTAF